MKPISKNIINLPEYIHASLNKKARDIEDKKSIKILNLGAGIPDFRTSNLYIEKISDFYRDPYSHYYPGYSTTTELKNAILNYHNRVDGVDLSDLQIHFVHGSKDAISHIPRLLLDKGDEILVPDPGYSGYIEPVRLVGGKIVEYKLDENFDIDIDSIISQISSKTKAIWINSPSNPTGGIISFNKLNKLVEICHQKGIWILFDTAYKEILFDTTAKEPSIWTIKNSKDCVIEVCSLSKSHSFAGYRIGWIIGNKEFVNGFYKLKTQIDSGVPLPIQKLTTFALNNEDVVWKTNMLNEYKFRMEKVGELLKSFSLNVINPKAGLYHWVKIPSNFNTSMEYATYLLEEHSVLVTPGIAYGENGDGFIRASFCVDISLITNKK